MFSESLLSRPLPLIPNPERPGLDFITFDWQGRDNRVGKLLLRKEHLQSSSVLLAHDPWFASQSENLDRDNLKGLGIEFGIREYSHSAVHVLQTNTADIGDFILKPVHRAKFSWLPVFKSREEKKKYCFDNPSTYGLFDIWGNRLTKKQMEDYAYKVVVCEIAQESLIHQLTIGLQLEKDWINKYHQPIKTEEPIGAFIDISGDKFAIFRFYRDLTFSRSPEYSAIQQDLDKKLEKLGYFFRDTQFLVPKSGQKIGFDNIVLMDLEMLIKFK